MAHQLSELSELSLREVFTEQICYPLLVFKFSSSFAGREEKGAMSEVKDKSFRRKEGREETMTRLAVLHLYLSAFHLSTRYRVGLKLRKALFPASGCNSDPVV